MNKELGITDVDLAKEEQLHYPVRFGSNVITSFADSNS